MRAAGRLLACAAFFGAGALRAAAQEPAHYIFFNRDHERIEDSAFLDTPAIAGAQLKFTWRQLEPERDRYDLDGIREALTFLERHGKRLFLQLQDVSFDTTIVNVPRYLRRDPAFGGGVALTYGLADNDSTAPPEGWVARRWDPAVQARFTRLLDTLGRAFDGRIAGIVLPETVVEFGSSGRLYPTGFTPAAYLAAVRAQMRAAGAAFRQSVVIQYANFMPGERLPDDDHGYLRGVYASASAAHVGVGGPDLLPLRPGQRAHSYPFIAGRGPEVPAGVAVQYGNLADVDPVTGRRVTAVELARFAREVLRLDYVFWGTQEPYYSSEVLPYLRSLDTSR